MSILDFKAWKLPGSPLVIRAHSLSPTGPAFWSPQHPFLTSSLLSSFIVSATSLPSSLLLPAAVRNSPATPQGCCCCTCGCRFHLGRNCPYHLPVQPILPVLKVTSSQRACYLKLLDTLGFFIFFFLCNCIFFYTF